MEYFKRCTCGHVNVYEQGMAPMFCEKCGFELMFITEEVYNGQQDKKLDKYKLLFDDDFDDENIKGEESEETIDKEKENIDSGKEDKDPQDWISKELIPYIVFPDGSAIPIMNSCTIGRSNVGKEFLGSYPFVSREHFRIDTRESGIGVIITDCSKFGTYINGRKIEKDVPTHVTNGAVINLSGKIDLRIDIK